jgi:hypothetical protein
MLWYRGWLETRIKFAMSLAFLAFMLVFVHSHPSKSQLPSAQIGWLAAITSSNPTYLMIVCAWTAGAGIATQPSFQAIKGLHGSTLFTLSLPVSRLRLIAVRAAIGWIEMVGTVAALCCGMLFLYPSLTTIVTPLDLLGYGATLAACISSLYFLSVLFATFLEEQWRMVATMVAFAGSAWLAGEYHSPASIDIFHAMGKGSPLIAHTIPWAPIAFSLALAAVFFVAALKIAQTREY